MADVVILYGQNACSRFGNMLDYWNNLWSIEQWKEVYFILVAPSVSWPKPPEDIRHVLRPNCWHVPPFADPQLEQGCPENIIKRIKAGRIHIHCVCADFDTRAAAADAPLSLLRAIQQAFTLGVVSESLYLMLSEDVAAREAQRQFVTALQNDYKDLHAYPYLIGTTMANGTPVGAGSSWRAVMSEIAVGVNGTRALIDRKLYSLGYASLNADDSELRCMRELLVCECLLKRCTQPITVAEAWQLLTTDPHPPQSLDVAAVSTRVSEWLKFLAAQQMSLPTAQECKNLRILAGVYDQKSMRISSAVERFYRVNQGAATKRQMKVEAFIGERMASVQARLLQRPNATEYPVELLDSIVAVLERQKNSKPMIGTLVFPTQKMMEGHTAYVDRCCELAQTHWQSVIQAETCVLCAHALIKALSALRAFVANAATLKRDLQAHCDPTAEMSVLQEKYPQYNAELAATVQYAGYELFSNAWLGSYAPLYTPQGVSMPGLVSTLIAEGERRLHDRMPVGFNGTFCDAINREFSDAALLDGFFNQYLSAGERMLYCPGDTPGAPISYYFVDDALKRSGWVGAHVGKHMIVHNDNIERLELYELGKDLAWYLEDTNNAVLSRCKQLPPGPPKVRSWDEDERDASGDTSRVDEQHVSDNTAAFPITEEAASPGSSDADATAPEDHHLALQCVDGAYMLTWDWAHGMTDGVAVRIESPGRPPLCLACTAAEYNANMPQGLNVGTKLPFGRVGVSVFYKGMLYARKDLPGRRNLVRYRLLPAKSGQVLELQGASEDVVKLVLQCVNSAGRIVLYPLYPQTAEGLHSYSGLHLGGECEVVPSPEEEYPTVQTMR